MNQQQATTTPPPPPPPPQAQAQAQPEIAPFDFAAAQALRLQRARELLEQEEKRNAASASSSEDQQQQQQQQTGAGGGNYRLQPANVGSNTGFRLEKTLYEAILLALGSAGLTSLCPPKIEAFENTLQYTLRARQKLDLYEVKLSSQRHFVLVRMSRSIGAFGKSGLAAQGRLSAATDLTIPLIGQTYTLMLDLNRYVVQLEGGDVTLVNEALLLSNINENVLNHYDLHATTVDVASSGGGGGLLGRVKENPTLLLALASAAVAVLGVVVVVMTKRRKST